MSGVGPISQDWEPVVIRKKAPNAAAKKDEKAVNAARRSGAEIETIKKCLYFSLYPSKQIFLSLL
jgi:putative transcription factor